ncbi:MAG: pentapeptide repeat-containing protein [Deltaproteobacteria bacterium]|nr:pentapeptide repeat-containing protein [Deltaproteobacteria bacterium]
MAVALPEGSLAGRDLSGRDLSSAQLSGRDLAGADLRGATLTDADLSDANLTGAKLTGAGLRGTRLLHADLTDVILDDADLTGAVLAGATLHRTSLHDVTAIDADFSHAEWSEASIKGGDWRDADLSGGSMNRVTIEGLTAKGARLGELRIEDSDLRRVALDGTHADGLVAVDASLERVALPGASLRNVAMRFTDLTKVDLRDADLADSIFESVDFRSPWLEGVKADGAHFDHCAGLGGDARRRLEEAGARLSLTLPARLVAAVFGASRRNQLLAVLALVAVGAGLWQTLFRNRGGARVAQPLTTEQLQVLSEFERRYDNEPDRRLPILLETAAFLRDSGADEEAEVRLRQALELIERDESEPPVAPVLALSDLLLEQQRFDDALSFTRELDQPGASAREVALSRLIVAQTLLERGDPERAKPVVQELLAHVAKYPAEAPRFRLRASRVVEQVQGPVEALVMLEGVPASLDVEARGEVDLERAALLGRLGNVAVALEAYDDLLVRLDDLPLLRERAREERAKLLKTGTDPEAEERRLLELLEGTDPELAAWSAVGLARLAMRQGQTDDAATRYRAALARFGQQGDVRMRATLELAELLASTGEVEAADEMLREQLSLIDEPEQVFSVRQALAAQRQQAQDLDGAVQIALETVEWAPNRSLTLRAKLQLAGLSDEAGAFDRAIDLYKEVALAQEDPEMTAAAWFGQATLMRRRGFPEAALPLMDSALLHLPAQHRKRGAIIVERAEVLADLGESSPVELEAMLADARAAGLPDTQPTVYASLLLRLAEQLGEAERYEDALNVYQQVANGAAAAEAPSLRQSAVEGEVATLVKLGRSGQAEGLLDRVDLGSLTDGGAEETCDARYTLALGRLETGNVADCVRALEELFGSCRSPRFLIRAVAESADALVEADAEAEAKGLLRTLRDESELPPAGRQVAALELGKLGSPEDLERASSGPDESLAALARIETGRRLADAGETSQAVDLLQQVAEDSTMEPVPRGLARFELGMIAKRAEETSSAKVWFALVRDESSEGWLRAQAEKELSSLSPAPGSTATP